MQAFFTYEYTQLHPQNEEVFVTASFGGDVKPSVPGSWLILATCASSLAIFGKNTYKKIGQLNSNRSLSTTKPSQHKLPYNYIIQVIVLLGIISSIFVVEISTALIVINIVNVLCCKKRFLYFQLHNNYIYIYMRLLLISVS